MKKFFTVPTQALSFELQCPTCQTVVVIWLSNLPKRHVLTCQCNNADNMGKKLKSKRPSVRQAI